ncbi:PLAC8 family-domain-containing protein [Biscogniauxia sp. FL1348]|nr:PLAC8 family-domain-containing protein [Biscogniauxia sp. FL1348]
MPFPTLLKWPKLAKNPLPMAPLPHAFHQLLKMGGDWESGLCNCAPFSSCILGTFLPCFHTSNYYFLRRDIFEIKWLLWNAYQNDNYDNLLQFLAEPRAAYSWVMLKRTEIRTRFAIPGDEIKDCCVAYWCTCCAIIQHDNEVTQRMPDPQTIISRQPQLAEAMMSLSQAGMP